MAVSSVMHSCTHESRLCNPKWRSDRIWFRQIAEMSAGAARLTDHSIEVKRGSLSTVQSILRV